MKPSSQDLAGFTPWPEECAATYRELGYWQGQSLGQMLRQLAQQHGQNTALVCGARRISYQELDARADQLAAGLARLGLVAQDRVVVQLPNLAEFFILCFALFRLGAIPVMALPAHRRSEIGYFCQHTEARAYVVAARDGGFDFCQLAREVKAECASLQHVIVVPQGEHGTQEFTAFDDLYASAVALPEVAASQVALLQLSGGSTGLPKLIPRTHDDYLYSVRASAKICELDAQAVYLCVLPVAHNFPLSSPGSLGVLSVGGCVVLARHAAPEQAFALIAAEKVSWCALVPPLALVWLEAAQRLRPKLASWQVLQVGGAKFNAEAAARVPLELGCRLQQVFGMAEGLVNYTRADDAQELILHTQGRPISPHDEIRIVDDADCPVAEGAIGHLQTRGPYTIRGYYKAESHNARAFTSDGFYRTGDLVSRLPSGHLIVQGRAKDQINRGGEKVAAEEVEQHLLAHPQVRDVALVAMPDPWLGEKSCAFVIAQQLDGKPPRVIELGNFLRARGLAQYKIPDRIEFVSELPKTAVGKVDKRSLRARLT